MSTATLLIKGTESDALIALNAHGLTRYTFLAPLKVDGRPEQRVSIPVEPRTTLAQLQRWYAEGTDTAPFPAGALLFFSYSP